MRAANWLSFIQLILKYGNPIIPSYDYQESRQRELLKLDSLPEAATVERESQSALIKSVLRLPFIGPLAAFASYYKTQQRWPTYIYHWPEKKLAYVRISKSASTSIQAALLGAQHDGLNIGELSVNQINYLGMSHVRPKLSAGYRCFTVVRNPVDRLISCYHDQCFPSEKGFYYFQDYLFGIIRPRVSIDRFLTIIQGIPDFLKDLHFRPQSSFLRDIPAVKVFKLEDDQQALSEFLGSYNLSLKHLHKNPVEKLKIQHLTPTSKELLKAIYHDDFKNFNYPVNF